MSLESLFFPHLNRNQIVGSVQRISSLTTVLIRLILSTELQHHCVCFVMRGWGQNSQDEV